MAHPAQGQQLAGCSQDLMGSLCPFQNSNPQSSLTAAQHVYLKRQRQQSGYLDLSSKSRARKTASRFLIAAHQVFPGFLLCFHRTLSSFGNKPKFYSWDFYFLPSPIFLSIFSCYLPTLLGKVKSKAFASKQKKTQNLFFFFSSKMESISYEKQDFSHFLPLILPAPYLSQQAHAFFSRKEK